MERKPPVFTSNSKNYPQRLGLVADTPRFDGLRAKPNQTNITSRQNNARPQIARQPFSRSSLSPANILTTTPLTQKNHTQTTDFKTNRPKRAKLKIKRKTDPNLILNLLDWIRDILFFPFKALGFLISAPFLALGIVIHRFSSRLGKKPKQAQASQTPFGLPQTKYTTVRQTLDLKNVPHKAALAFKAPATKNLFAAHRLRSDITAPARQMSSRRLPNKTESTLTPKPQKSKRLFDSFGLPFHIKFDRNFASGLVLAIAILVVLANFAYQSSLKAYRSVYAEATTAQDYLVIAQDAIVNQDFITAKNAFLSAKDKFSSALDALSQTKSASVIPGINSRIEAGEMVLNTGYLISNAGYGITTSLEPITDILKGTASSQVDENTSMADYTSKIMTVMTIARPQLKQALDDMNQAAELLDQVDTSLLTSDQATQAGAAKAELAKLTSVLDQVYQISFLLPDLLGNNGARHYLLLFQNTAEQRATGGFIGSYGIVSFNDGKLEEFFTDNVYNPDGQLSVQGICDLPPKPLQTITECWGMRDANWSPDFPTSARKVANYYETGSGRQTDGVISITPEILQSLLDMLGPIYLNQWNEVVTSENVIPLIQYKVDVEFKDAKDPKLFLIDLSQVIFQRMFELKRDQWPKLFELLSTGLTKKDIMIYPFEQKSYQFVANKGWDGSIKTTDKDYLMIIGSNIGGTKANTFVEKRYRMQTDIYADGVTENTLTITYNHTGSWEWPSGVLYEYLRIYVPQGAELIESNNPFGDGGKESITEVYQDLGKTVFADYIRLYPGGTISLTYKYRLPFTIDLTNNQTYSLLTQKQPGTFDVPLERTIKFDSFKLEPLQASSDLQAIDKNTLSGTTLLNTDNYYEVKFVEHSVF